MKNVIFIILILALSYSVYSQSRKDLKEENVSKRVEWRYKYKNGKEQKTKESVRYFDKNGNRIESIEYDKEGKEKKHVKTTYNDNNDPLKIVYFEADGSVKKIVKYKYEGKLKTEKRVYNSKKELKTKKVYIYKKD